MTNDAAGQVWWRWTLRAAAVIVFVAGSTAFLFGATSTFFAVTPGTDMGDANVLIREAPRFVLGGILAIVASVFLWRADGRPRIRNSDKATDFER